MTWFEPGLGQPMKMGKLRDEATVLPVFAAGRNEAAREGPMAENRNPRPPSS